MKEEEIRKREVFNRYLELVRLDVERYFDAASYIEVGCPACGKKECRKEFEKMGFTYVSCDNCGTLYVNPRPTCEMLEFFYARSESTYFWVEEFFKPVEPARREKIFRPRAEYMQDAFPDARSGVIGDVGAGFGIFLEELKQKWPKARLVAIEPSIQMADICLGKGLEVIAETIEKVEGYGETFDIVTMFELFEHLYNPEAILQKIHDILKPNGVLLITTLNVQGFDILELWEKSKSISPPHHLNFFNTRSIGHLLEQCGFDIESAETPGQLDWDILEGMYRHENVEIGRFWKHVANQSEEVKKHLQEWITNSGLSSHMRVIARKIPKK